MEKRIQGKNNTNRTQTGIGKNIYKHTIVEKASKKGYERQKKSYSGNFDFLLLAIDIYLDEEHVAHGEGHVVKAHPFTDFFLFLIPFIQYFNNDCS